MGSNKLLQIYITLNTSFSPTMYGVVIQTYFIALSVSLYSPVNGLIFFSNFIARLFLLSVQLENLNSK